MYVSLEDMKFTNYGHLRMTLIDAADEILEDVCGIAHVREAMKTNITEWKQVMGLFETAAEAWEDVKVLDNGTVELKMIAPESTNENDPIYDTLKIVKVGDIFWAKRIVQNAFYELITPKEENHA